MSSQECEEQAPAITPRKCLRLQGICFLLTFPQTEVSKELAMERIKTHPWTTPLEWAVVAQEKHANGDPHLHAVVKFEERFQTRKQDCFDFICQKHGNYQVSRSAKGSVQYVIKYGDYVSYLIDVPQFLSKEKEKKVGHPDRDWET